MQAHEIYRNKVDDRTWLCWCVECNQRFEATRSDASFCSARCRVAFSRGAAKLDNQIMRMSMFGADLKASSAKYSKSEKLYQAMLALEKQIKSALANFQTE